LEGRGMVFQYIVCMVGYSSDCDRLQVGEKCLFKL
jgi:hypothetical protein